MEMQVWLESGTRQEGVDLLVGDDLEIDGAALYIDGRQVGRVVDVGSSDGQAKARSMSGSVEWILLELGEWKMIPIENIIAACDGVPTKVAARISSSEQVLGAAFALQIGVDAILVTEDILPTALIAKSQRGEITEEVDNPVKTGNVSLTEIEVIEVKEGGIGDRVCVLHTLRDNLGHTRSGTYVLTSVSDRTMVGGLKKCPTRLQFQNLS